MGGTSEKVIQFPKVAPVNGYRSMLMATVEYLEVSSRVSCMVLGVLSKTYFRIKRYNVLLLLILQIVVLISLRSGLK